MKKVAIALTGDKQNVSAHFGTCESYMVLDVDNGDVKNKEIIENPHYQHSGGCVVPDFMKSIGANVIITGGMGARAVEKCSDFGIEAILGNVGPLDQIIEMYLNGELKSSGAACTHNH